MANASKVTSPAASPFGFFSGCTVKSQFGNLTSRTVQTGVQFEKLVTKYYWISPPMMILNVSIDCSLQCPPDSSGNKHQKNRDREEIVGLVPFFPPQIANLYNPGDHPSVATCGGAPVA